MVCENVPELELFARVEALAFLLEKVSIEGLNARVEDLAIVVDKAPAEGLSAKVEALTRY